MASANLPEIDEDAGESRVILPAKLTPAMEATWRAAFIGHLHKRRHIWGAIKHPQSAEAVAFAALVAKHGQPVAEQVSA